MDKYVGKRLDGRYEIQEIVGVGGMAVVYKAYDSIDGRVVAVKILREEYLANEEFRRRFKNESKAIAVLSHPNIVKVFDVSFGDLIQYIVMEYIHGVTLKDYAERRGVLPWSEAVGFTKQILSALQHAHDKGVVHRDIKPQNIMVLEDRTLKVTDFGIARFAHAAQLTVTDKAIGSVHYISPEQARGDLTDGKTDLYSVGVLMYELLTGSLPFDSDSAVSVALMQVQSEPTRPRELNPSIPLGLEQVILHAMQKDPRKRYASAAEMRQDLLTLEMDPTATFGYNDRPFVLPRPAQNAVEPVPVPPRTDYPARIDYPAEAADYPARANYPAREDYGAPSRVARPGLGISPEEAARKIDTLYGDDEFEEAEEGPAPRRRAPVIPIMSAVAAAFVIILGVLVWYMWKQNTAPPAPTANVTCPDLVGKYTLAEARQKYPDLNIVKQQEAPSNQFKAGIISEQNIRAGTSVKKNSEVQVTVSTGPQTATMPELTGKTQNDAETQLNQINSELNLGLQIQPPEPEFSDTIPQGSVISTDPKAGTKLAPGAKVTLHISQGAQVKMVTVPDVTKISQTDANSLLEKNHLTAGAVMKQDSDLPANYVISQDPAANSQVQQGTVVNLVISTGKLPTRSMTFTVIFSGDMNVVVNSCTAFIDGQQVWAYNKSFTPGTLGGLTVTISSTQQAADVVIRMNGFDYETVHVDFVEKTYSVAEGPFKNPFIVPNSSSEPPKPSTSSKTSTSSKPSAPSTPSKTSTSSGATVP